MTVERWAEKEREVVEHPGSVAVVAIDSDGFVTLVRQFREPAARPLLELPAGPLDEGEDALECAQRELAEETGLTGGSWRQLAAFYTAPGFCRERMHLFLAERLERGEPSPSGDEEIELVRIPLADARARIGEIEDAKTLAGLLLVAMGEVSLPGPA